MKFILIPLLTFVLFAKTSVSQNSYSTSELQSFVDIYMEAKNKKSIVSFDKITLEKLAESGISYARYKEIFQSSLNGEKIQLKTNEKVFFDELEELEDKYNGEQEVRIKEACDAKSYNYKTYTEIERKYKNDINFQKSLKQYFDRYLKGRK